MTHMTLQTYDSSKFIAWPNWGAGGIHRAQVGASCVAKRGMVHLIPLAQFEVAEAGPICKVPKALFYVLDSEFALKRKVVYTTRTQKALVACTWLATKLDFTLKFQ
ncbi:hypothetical protein VNO77_37870 [Canavalia gladiata]|uniref:Uncharacterized protein n=1 Tax=Canavalia gladiata TaxID=3824 RepID=A0AAN9K8K8_CANGL